MMSSSANPEAEWFGYTRVAPDEKTARVGRVFSSVASRYDLMNDLMSGGLHRLWKDRLVARMAPKPGQTILDVAGGTADVALRCMRATRGQATVIVSDINPDMLAVGRAKALDRGWLDRGTGGGQGGLQWLTANAEALPLDSRSVDIVNIAFGLRNVTRIDKALSEFARVLRPGGRFYCLEFSPVVAKPLRRLYERYSFDILPFLGDKVAHDRESYQYLAESIRRFPAPRLLAERMQRAGFDTASWTAMTGGIAVIHQGMIL